MLATIIATARLLRRVARASTDPATRGIVLLALLTLVTGTVFYVTVEGWRVLDAVSFAVVTLTTIGYGDLAPVTDLGKVFTIAYSLTGIGVIAAFVTALAVNVRADEARPGDGGGTGLAPGAGAADVAERRRLRRRGRGGRR